jgi:hypothetical protein
MKFGKRRWEDRLEKGSSVAATPSADSVPESWDVPGDAEPASAASVPPPPDEPATVVDGDAIELPITEVGAQEPVAVAGAQPDAVVAEPEPEPAPAFYEPEPSVYQPAVSEPLPPPGASWAPSPPPPLEPPMPYPVAEEPVLVYTSSAASPAVTPLAEAGAAHASGHASGTSPSWPEPVMALAAERPEVVVGAAFAGGLLFAMILRRLGN